MLRIGYRAHDLGSFESASELGKRIEEIRKTSFIQLALKKVIPSSKPWQEWDEEYISSIASELKSHGVSVAIVGCYINPIHPDPDRRKTEVERFVKSLSLAKAFGCPYVATETGSEHPELKYSVNTSDPKNIEIFKDSLSKMLDAAEKYDAYVAIEAVARSHTISSPARMRDILETFRTDRLKVIFDPVNLIPYTGLLEPDGVPLRIPTAETEHRFVTEVLDLYKDKLIAIHCKDYILTEEAGLKVGNLPALTGNFRWKDFADEIHRRNIDVPWLMENLDPKTVAETSRKLEAL